MRRRLRSSVSDERKKAATHGLATLSPLLEADEPGEWSGAGEEGPSPPDVQSVSRTPKSKATFAFVGVYTAALFILFVCCAVGGEGPLPFAR